MAMFTRTLLRSSFAQPVRLFSSEITRTGTRSVLIQRTIKSGPINPTKVRDQFQSFGDIVKIWSGRNNRTSIAFSSEQAQKLLDTAVDGKVTTESGDTYYIRAWEPELEPPTASTYLEVRTFEPNVKEADIQKAFSTFGPLEKVVLELECPAIGEMTYTAHFIVQFTNVDDAVKANSTLVSSSNGVVLPTKMVPSTSFRPSPLLQFLVERPVSKIRSGYNSHLFVNDLARAANVPREDLEHCVLRKLTFYQLGLACLVVKTKSIEAAQRIKAVQSADIHNILFSVKYYYGDDLPKKKETETETKKTNQSSKKKKQTKMKTMKTETNRAAAEMKGGDESNQPINSTL
ncbi:hypothetical protein C8J56DRAFT_964819 [Mycena floridula]|nr:hypothetical protein C8J56DRAFT_964819 [Mycena floridula]